MPNAPAKLCSSFVSICPCEVATMQVLFVLRFYHPDKRFNAWFNPCVDLKMAIKMNSVVKQLLYV